MAGTETSLDASIQEREEHSYPGYYDQFHSDETVEDHQMDAVIVNYICGTLLDMFEKVLCSILKLCYDS